MVPDGRREVTVAARGPGPRRTPKCPDFHRVAAHTFCVRSIASCLSVGRRGGAGLFSRAQCSVQREGTETSTDDASKGSIPEVVHQPISSPSLVFNAQLPPTRQCRLMSCQPRPFIVLPYHPPLPRLYYLQQNPLLWEAPKSLASCITNEPLLQFRWLHMVHMQLRALHLPASPPVNSGETLKIPPPVPEALVGDKFRRYNPPPPPLSCLPTRPLDTTSNKPCNPMILFGLYLVNITTRPLVCFE